MTASVIGWISQNNNNNNLNGSENRIDIMQNLIFLLFCLIVNQKVTWMCFWLFCEINQFYGRIIRKFSLFRQLAII